MKTEARSLLSSLSLANTFSLLLAATRPREWIKNTFLFAPLFFAQKVLQPEAVLKSTLAFIVFCLAAGGVYLINDICDREEDRKHPQKRNRPIAAGTLPVSMAAMVAGLFLVVALGTMPSRFRPVALVSSP